MQGSFACDGLTLAASSCVSPGCERLGPALLDDDEASCGAWRCREGNALNCFSFVGEGVAAGDEKAEGKGCWGIMVLYTTCAVMFCMLLKMEEMGR